MRMSADAQAIQLDIITQPELLSYTRANVNCRILAHACFRQPDCWRMASSGVPTCTDADLRPGKPDKQLLRLRAGA
jgi:hypothetical protein